jgi:uncharacterized protein (DUF983 family)
MLHEFSANKCVLPGWESVKCPHCGKDTLIPEANYRPRRRRCRACGKMFSVYVDDVPTVIVKK